MRSDPSSSGAGEGELVGALADPIGHPIEVRLGGRTARYVRLRQLATDPVYYWSIAELKVVQSVPDWSHHEGIRPIRPTAGGSRDSHGQLARAAVSVIAWKGWPSGLLYSRTSPVTVSVTVRSNSTFPAPPANTHQLLLIPQPLIRCTTARIPTPAGPLCQNGSLPMERPLAMAPVFTPYIPRYTILHTFPPTSAVT